METKLIVEKLVEFRSIHQAAIDTVSKLLEEVIPWTLKEFTYKDAVNGGLPSQHARLQDLEPCRAKDEGFLVPAHSSLGITFGDLHTIPGTEVLGIPETITARFGVTRPFRLKHLLIDETIAPHFHVSQLFVGNKMVWYVGATVPATRFVTPVELPHNDVAKIGIALQLTVQNTTDEPQWFRCKLVGEELILPWAEKSVEKSANA